MYLLELWCASIFVSASSRVPPWLRGLWAAALPGRWELTPPRSRATLPEVSVKGKASGSGRLTVLLRDPPSSYTRDLPRVPSPLGGGSKFFSGGRSKHCGPPSIASHPVDGRGSFGYCSSLARGGYGGGGIAIGLASGGLTRRRRVGSAGDFRRSGRGPDRWNTCHSRDRDSERGPPRERDLGWGYHCSGIETGVHVGAGVSTGIAGPQTTGTRQWGRRRHV